jgi:hypothetical protein
MDADAEWHFRRLPAPDSCLELCFRSHPAAIAAIEDSLRRRCVERGWQLRERDGDVHGTPWERCAGVSHAEARLAGALSVLSSDLALELLATGGFDAAEQVGVAALHLRLLTGLVPPHDRLAFLFQCWQHSGRSLAPSVRVELVKRADEITQDIAGTTARLATASRYGHLWGWYGRSLLARWERHRSDGDVPRAYVLFQHAYLTHNRLGICPEEEAIAAMALRSAMADAGTGLADPAGIWLRLWGQRAQRGVLKPDNGEQVRRGAQHGIGPGREQRCFMAGTPDRRDGGDSGRPGTLQVRRGVPHHHRLVTPHIQQVERAEHDVGRRLRPTDLVGADHVIEQVECPQLGQQRPCPRTALPGRDR